MTSNLISIKQGDNNAPGARPRVFLTDPSLAVIDRLDAMLADIAQIVGRATTARDTLVGIRRAYPRLAVFDIAMAHGAELLVDLKQHSSGLVVAILTHSTDDTTRNKCLQLGANYFLDKLYDTGRLRDIVVAIAAMEKNLPRGAPPAVH